MSTEILPVPDVILASDFPTLADRPAGTYNAKAAEWANSENAMANRLKEIADVTHNNATAAEEAATALADPDVQAVVANLPAIINVNDNAANINSVSGNATNINAVSGNASNINTVAAAGVDVAAVAAVAPAVTAVAAIDTEVSTVAGNAADVSAVADAVVAVNAVANAVDNVGLVAENVSAVNTAAANIVDIQAAPGAASAAATSEYNAAQSASAALQSEQNAAQSAQEAADVVLGQVFDDDTVSSNYGWTSQKITGELAEKQTALESGVNIKTINGASLLEGGDILVGDVTLEEEQTLTNKTLQGAVLTGATEQAGPVSSSVNTVTGSGTITFDLSLGNYFFYNQTAASTFEFTNPPVSGKAFAFTIEVQRTSGAITFPPSVKWSGGNVPALTNSKIHLFTFVTRDGGVNWVGMANVDYEV